MLKNFCKAYGYPTDHLGLKEGHVALATAIGDSIRAMVPRNLRVNTYNERRGPITGKDKLRVGDVVTLKGERIGTIKYIGGVKNSLNKKYGIQLHTCRGDCSGEVEDQKYFDCPEGLGIFVERTELTGQCTNMLKSLKYIDFDVRMNVLEEEDNVDFHGP